MELTTSDDLDTTLEQILMGSRLKLLRLYFRLFFLSLLFLGMIFLSALLMKFSKENSFYLICTISETMGLVLYYYINFGLMFILLRILLILSMMNITIISCILNFFLIIVVVFIMKKDIIIC